jgi:menaquinone-dependent protoporphyrinogen oxidase
MKVLVSAASKYGSTEEIGRSIAEVLEERGLETEVVPPEDVRSLESYDAVVLGSAVYAGKWMPDAKAMAERFGDAFASRPTWIFSSGPIGDPATPEEDPVDTEPMMSLTGAREHRVFAGKLVRKQLSFGEKAIVIALRAPEGDFRDWDEIRGWASSIADALTS